MPYLKPAAGRQVRIPRPPYPLMPEAGLNVDPSPYWAKRLVKGDVVPAEKPEPAKPAKGKAVKE